MNKYRFLTKEKDMKEKREIMKKKYTIAVLILILVFSCGKKDKKTQNSQSKPKIENIQDDKLKELMKKAEKIVFTGMIDQFFEYRYGVLEYRSLKFENEMHETDNYQGNAVVNYCEREIPYTRIIEHKHFEFGKQPKTVITKEYPEEWKEGDEPYYPVNDDKNNEIFRKYKKLAENEKNVIFGGRLADYKYYDMCNIIEKVLETVKVELG